MAFNQIVTSVTIINSGMIGYMGISLTDFSATTASAIASGSAIEIAGAYFKADADLSPGTTSWSAITTGTTAYLGLIPAGSPGSQSLTAEWYQDAPVWSTSKQGWYATAASNIRIVASAIKGTSSEYLKKTILTNNPTPSRDFQGKIVTITGGSGNFVVPDNVYKLNVICAGGGGGGGGGGNGGSSRYYQSGGGGGGHPLTKSTAVEVQVLPGQIISYSVGTGGAGGGANTNGGSGTDSTFGSITGTGSGGGTSYSNSSGFTFGGSGGSGVCPGENGGGYGGGTPGAIYGNAGNGGGPHAGKGGIAFISNGGNGSYGSGGGGGGYNASGGNGGDGIIIIEY